MLDSEQFLKEVCNRLDTETKSNGDYRDVCSHYGIDRYEVVTDFAKHGDGPSRVLLEYLAVTRPQLTVADFVRVLKIKTQSNDVIRSLEECDNQLDS